MRHPVRPVRAAAFFLAAAPLLLLVLRAAPAADLEPAPGAVALTLPDALRLASLANLDIAQARLIVEQALAGQLRAQAQVLPNLSAGPAYNNHQGTIQKTEGNIINMDRDSLYIGGGPALSLSLSQALFAPRIAEQVVAATRAGEQRVTNNTLLAVAEAYLNVLRARRRLDRLNETLEYLTSDRGSKLRADSTGLLPLISAFVETGKSAPSEKAREEWAAGVQELRLAIAELARLLHQDPTTSFWPQEADRAPLPLPGEEWLHQGVEELVAYALGNRPELAESRSLVLAALERYRAAKWRPLLPNVVVSYGYGAFGGGPPIVGTSKSGGSVFGQSGQIANMGQRGDFDAALVWRMDNLGLGNLAEQREQRSLHEQAVVHQLQVQDVVMTQVVQAYDQVVQTAERVRITRSALFGPGGEPAGPVYTSLRLNFERIRKGQGQPLEVLDSIRSLNDLLEAHAQALTEFDRARFRLLVALGLPAEALLDPSRMPRPSHPESPAVPCRFPPSSEMDSG